MVMVMANRLALRRRIGRGLLLQLLDIVQIGGGDAWG